MAGIGVTIVGDAASVNAALGSASASLVKFGETANAVFDDYSTAALKAQVASDRLGVSLAKVPAGSTAAAAAVARYRGEIDALQATQMAAVQEIGSALTRYITVPALAVGAVSVDLATKFQSAMELIHTQAGASTAELDRMSKSVLDLVTSGHSFGQTATDLAKGLFSVESEGIRGASALNVLKVAAAGAAVGQTDLADTANALTSAMRVYKVPASDAAETMASLNAAIGQGKLHMDDLTAALGTKFLPVARQVGITLPQALAALDIFTKEGVPAASAATNLTTAFLKFEAPTAASAKALATLGLTSNQLAGDLQSGGLPSALGTLSNAYDQLVESSGKVAANQAVISGFGGLKGGAAVLSLVQEYAGYVKTLDQSQRQADPATFWGDAARTMDTPAAKLHEDFARVTGDLIRFGDVLAPLAADAAGYVAAVVGAFSDLPGPVKTELGVLVGLLAVGGPLMLGLAGVARAVKLIGTTFGITAAESTAASATIDTDITEIGAASTVAGGRVALLTKTLAGVAAIAGLGYLDYHYGKKALTTASTAGFSAGANKSPYQKGSELDDLYQAGLRGEKGKIKVGGGGTLDIAGLGGKELDAYQFGLTSREHRAASGHPFGAATNTGALKIQVPGTLTKAQRLQIGLAANPDSPKLNDEEAKSIEGTIAWLRRRLAAGKITTAAYTAHMTTLEGELHSLTTKATTGTNKDLAAARKLQVAHAQTVTAHATGLKATVARFSTLAPVNGGVPRKEDVAADALIRFYQAEAKDSKLTADERARYHDLAVTARKNEAALATRDADDYERVRIDTAKAAYSAVRGVKGTTPQQEAALRREIGVYDTAIHNKNLTPTEKGSFVTARGTAQGELAKIRDQYTTPIGLQLDLAKDQALSNTPAIASDARRIKNAAMEAIKQDHLTKQGMIDAWNEIAQANQILGTNATGYKDVSAYKLVQGLAFKSDAAKREAEIRIAQAMQHQGRIPTGLGVNGAVATGTKIELHTHTHLDGSQIAHTVTSHQLRGNAPAARTGRLPGSRRGLS